MHTDILTRQYQIEFLHAVIQYDKQSVLETDILVTENPFCIRKGFFSSHI